MNTEQVLEERILDIFKGHNELMAEEVFPLYEEVYGETSRSNSIHTTLSRLTKKNFLYVVCRKVSPQSHKTVNVWKYVDGSMPMLESLPEAHKPTNSELNNEAEILRAKNKNLEETNMKLLGIIENLREELDKTR